VLGRRLHDRSRLNPPFKGNPQPSGGTQGWIRVGGKIRWRRAAASIGHYALAGDLDAVRQNSQCHCPRTAKPL